MAFKAGSAQRNRPKEYRLRQARRLYESFLACQYLIETRIPLGQ